MAASAESITKRLHAEIERVPKHRRAALLKIVHAYREAVEQDVDEDIDPAASIRRGLADIRAGRVHPIETLWDGVKSV